MTDSALPRRQLLTLAAGAAALASLSRVAVASKGEKATGKQPPSPAEPKTPEPAPYELPALPYATDALNGFLSAEILELHHGKHHKAYVDGLNKALADLAQARADGNFAALKGIERNLAFHGSGHVLHSLYWRSMSPQGGGAPGGQLAAMLMRDFGSIDAFRTQFAEATKQAEASAWGLLVYEPIGRRLLVTAVEDHQNMSLQGAVPLVACDVWEHAYYLRYRNKRAEYVDRFFDVVDWKGAAERLSKALGA
jgi:Fe-Mn family superoxide dismutase